MNAPQAIVRYLQTFAEDENFGLLLLNFTVATPDRPLRVAEKIAAIHPTLPKPLIVCWPVGNMARPGFTCLEKAGIPLFFQPARCLGQRTLLPLRPFPQALDGREPFVMAKLLRP
jgi:acetate---CoA ligase (ADP-forming)